MFPTLHPPPSTLHVCAVLYAFPTPGDCLLMLYKPAELNKHSTLCAPSWNVPSICCSSSRIEVVVMAPVRVCGARGVVVLLVAFLILPALAIPHRHSQRPSDDLFNHKLGGDSTTPEEVKGDPLDPMITGSMIGGGAVFSRPSNRITTNTVEGSLLELGVDPRTMKGDSSSADEVKGDPLDPMITGSMIGGGAVFLRPNLRSVGDADASFLETKSASARSLGIGFGPSSWVDKLVKTYTKQAKSGKATAMSHQKVKIVQNNNLLSHIEPEEHPEKNQEDTFKRTQEAGKKAVAEQKSKEQDEASQKKLEQASKHHVQNIKKKMKEEQIKQDEEQDAKEVEEEKVKAGEAERKRNLEQQTKQDVTKLKAQMEEEAVKTAEALEAKKQEEQQNKEKMESASKAEIQAAVEAANAKRAQATKEMADKRVQEGEAKQRESQQEEKEKNAEDTKKQSEFAEQHFKKQEEIKSTIRGPAFKPVKGMIVATNERLLPSQNWTGGITYTFWVKLEEVQRDWSSLLHKGQQNWDRNPFFAFYPGQSRLHVRSGTRPNPPDWSGDTNVGCDPADLITLKQWTWVAMTHRAGSMAVYFGDGRSMRVVCSAALNAPVQNQGGLYACDPFHMQPNALIADLRVYNRVLPADQLKALMEQKNGLS